MLVPFAGDIFLLFTAIVMMFRPSATWKYRIAIFLGTILVIWLSWIIVGIVMPGYYFALLDNTLMMAVAYWLLLAVLFVPTSKWTEKRFLPALPPTSEQNDGAA